MKTLVPFSMVKPDGWPASFRRLVEARTPPPDPLAKRSKAVGWKESTYKQYVSSLGYFLGWLRWSERYQEGVELAGYVTVEIAGAYRDDMEEFGLSPPLIANRLDGIRAAVQALAPEYDTSWLMLGINRLRDMPSDRRRTRERIQHTADVVKVGTNLMRDATQMEDAQAFKRDLQFRDGLLLVFMALAVPRINVVPKMRLGQHLIRLGDSFKIVWSKEEMKSDQPYSARLVPELSELIARYLDEFRPGLLARNHEPGAAKEMAVWLTRHGTPLSQGAIYHAIIKRTCKAFAESIFPHALRHGATTTLAVERPDLIDIATPLLQHRQSGSRQRYNLAASIEASSEYGDALDACRNSSSDGRKLMRRLSRGPRTCQHKQDKAA